MPVVAVPRLVQVPEGSTLRRMICLPERVVPLDLRVPERVKVLLTAGLELEVVRESCVGVGAPTVSSTAPTERV